MAFLGNTVETFNTVGVLYHNIWDAAYFKDLFENGVVISISYMKTLSEIEICIK